MTNTDAFITDQTIRRRLTDVRKQKRLTQKEVSIISGISVNTISAIEASERSITLRSLILYARALGTELVLKDIRKGDIN